MRTTERASSDPTPEKPSNKGMRPAEAGEGRRPAEGNSVQAPAPQTLSWTGAWCGLHRVRIAARRDKRARFTALLHHVTIDLLRSSYHHLKKGAAPGVDGVTWQEYGRDLEARLSDLHGRIHRGAYQARPITKSLDPEKRWEATTIGSRGAGRG